MQYCGIALIPSMYYTSTLRNLVHLYIPNSEAYFPGEAETMCSNLYFSSVASYHTIIGRVGTRRLTQQYEALLPDAHKAPAFF